MRRMVRAGLEECKLLEQEGFQDIKISLKAFDVYAMIEANRRIASMVPYPIHLGVTESGTPKPGAIRSAIGIGTLLMEGIGDTIRSSLSARSSRGDRYMLRHPAGDQHPPAGANPCGLSRLRPRAVRPYRPGEYGAR